jgi:hypothetical protein
VRCDGLGESMRWRGNGLGDLADEEDLGFGGVAHICSWDLWWKGGIEQAEYIRRGNSNGGGLWL